MRTEILMPKLGLTMTQGTVMEWIKKVGEPVSKGEILYTVENDKAVVEVESPAAGILEEILVPPGETQEVGKPVAYLSSTSTLTQSPRESSSRDHQEAPAYVLASPLAKRLAREKGIDLSTIRGTGPEGAVVERDLERIPQQPPSPFPSDLEAVQPARQHPSPSPAFAPASGRRTESTLPAPSTIHTLTPFQIRAAERMVQSWTTIPQFTLWADVDSQPLEDFHQALKAKGMPVSFTVLLAKFLALTLKQYPLLNASWQGQGKVEIHSQIHVGIATDTPLGLFVPVLKDCGTKTIQALQEEWQELSRRGKEGKLTAQDIAEGTITLTNLGMFGVKRFQPIVNPPQVAILSVGEVRRVPREGNTLAFVSVMEFGLSADHRVVDGAYGARFLKSYKEALESPLLTLASLV